MLKVKLTSGDDVFVVTPTPEKISCKVAGRWATYDLLSPGPAEIKNGDLPDELSFDGLLISENSMGYGIIGEEDWLPPMSAITLLQGWHRSGAQVTLSIGDDVYVGGAYPQHPFDGKVFYIGQFGWEHQQGYGNIPYSISLREVRRVGVQSQKPMAIPKAMTPPADGKILVTEVTKSTPASLSKQYTDQYAMTDPFIALMSAEQKSFLASNGYLQPGTYTFPDAWKNVQKGTVR